MSEIEANSFMEKAKKQLGELTGHPWSVGDFLAIPKGDRFRDPSEVYAFGDRVPGDFPVATEAARLHFLVIGDPARMGSIPGPSPGVVVAVPVFDPKIYDPSPVMRPVLGVATFAGARGAEEICSIYHLRLVVSKWAELLVSQLPGAVQSRPIVGTWGPFGPPLESLDRAHTVLDDMNRAWIEFRPGLYAKDSSLSEYRRISRELAESEAYRKSLEGIQLIVPSPEETRAAVEEAMRPFRR